MSKKRKRDDDFPPFVEVKVRRKGDTYRSGSSGYKTVLFVPSLFLNHPLVGCHPDSKIFLWISGLKKHPLMKKEKKSFVEKVQDMFTNYDICDYRWQKLVKFLSVSSKIFDEKDWYYIESVIELAIKIGMGGVLSEVERMKLEKEKKIQTQYNPLTPKEDVKKEYVWVICKDFNIQFTRDHKVEDGWCAVKHFSENLTDLVWWRKRREQSD